MGVRDESSDANRRRGQMVPNEWEEAAARVDMLGRAVLAPEAVHRFDRGLTYYVPSAAELSAVVGEAVPASGVAAPV